MKNTVGRALIQSLLILGFSFSAVAGDLEWGGLYRIEGNYIDNSEVKSGDKRTKEYGVHHLILRPRIVAADGLYINSQFHLLTGDVGGPQLGSIWGNGVDTNGANSSSSEDSAALSEHNQEELFAVSEFYLTFTQEYGSLIVGRAPLHFGLGMTYNGGKNLFDHYYDNRDLVGYKIVMGNFFFTPMLAKVKEGTITGHDDISETMVHVQYESAESNTAMGFMYSSRTGGSAGNDVAIETGSQFGSDTPYAATGVTGSLDIKTMNIFFAKTWSNDRVGFEIVNQTGDYGVSNSAGNEISQSAFAAAFEYERLSEKRMNWGLKMGWASGDDPGTVNEYEGFSFDRNYDVALLMFNQALGRTNLFRSEGLGTRYGQELDGVVRNSSRQDPDIEAIGNVMYFAPRLTYKWRDAWTIEGVLATGYLDQTEYFGKGDADKDLGYEMDLSLVYSPYERLTWKNTLAVFMPGGAYELDGGSSTAFGLVSRAAISF